MSRLRVMRVKQSEARKTIEDKMYVSRGLHHISGGGVKASRMRRCKGGWLADVTFFRGEDGQEMQRDFFFCHAFFY